MRYLLISLVVVVAMSCDDRLEGFLGDGVEVTFNNGVISDSVKLGLKSGDDYSLFVKVANPEVIARNTIISSFGSAEFYQNNTKVTQLSIQREMLIRIRPLEVEPLRISVSFSDAVGTTSKFDLDLVVFQNIAPVAKHTFSQVTRTDNLKEYLFNGSTSVDKDQKFGGGIQAYKWVINGTEYLRTVPTLTLIKDVPTSFTGSFSVVDSDGAWSNIINF